MLPHIQSMDLLSASFDAVLLTKTARFSGASQAPWYACASRSQGTVAMDRRTSSIDCSLRIPCHHDCLERTLNRICITRQPVTVVNCEAAASVATPSHLLATPGVETTMKIACLRLTVLIASL